MKILITSLIIILWYIFFIEVPIVGVIDLFVLISAVLWNFFDDWHFYVYWLFGMSLIIDVLSLHWLGVYAFSIFFAITLLIGFNRFFKILESDKRQLFLVLFVSISLIIQRIILNLDQLKFINLEKLAFTIIVNIIFVFVVDYLYKHFKDDNVIKL